MQATTFFGKSPSNDSASANDFWENLRAIALPFWYPTNTNTRAFADVIRAWGMLAFLIVLIILLVAATAYNSFASRYLIDIITKEQDFNKFVNTVTMYGVGLVAVMLLLGFARFLRKQIALDWYQWLNNQILHKYLSNRAYYKINFIAEIDNPDQRISQQIEPLTRNALSFFATFLERVLEMITFLGILWSLSHFVAIVLFVYTVFGNLISIYLAQELNKIKQEELEHEADYNYSVTHVRNHAESIAFFRGEKQELNIIHLRFNNVIQSAKRRINWEVTQDIFNRGYQAAIQIFPFIVLGPLEIRGEIGFGEIAQASLACNLFATAIAELIREFATSGRFSSYVDRLVELSDALEIVTKPPENLSTIQTTEANQLIFENVTLQTPNYEQVIVENLSVAVQPGEGLLIVGPSGRGKSSLLRAIAGLWNAGTGNLVRPPLEEVLFLPQRPYIILGTLREQLIYPNINQQIADSQLISVLQQVNLQNILSRIDSLDSEVPWENILSLGEQQRLAFARLLISQPRFTILDEATSALDLTNEINLYQHLQVTNTTFISVGHRESLLNYHQWVLELSYDSGWQLLTVQDYRQQKANITNPPTNPTVNIDISPNNESPNPSAGLNQDANAGLSHKEITELSSYSIKTVRSKASKGESITTRNGVTYRYNKDPKVLKWIRVEEDSSL